ENGSDEGDYKCSDLKVKESESAPAADEFSKTHIRALGRHFEEEVGREEPEDSVGSPAGEERRKQAGGAHGFEERRGGGRDDPHSDRGGTPADGAASARQKCERSAEQDDDGSNQREREFLVPLDAEASCVEAGLPQTGDVLSELAPVHLIGLQNFAAEVRRRFRELRERVGGEGQV